ncbi:MAG: Dabb family protein [Burkholderiales bacterium]|jgi:quinol monooxygenase YgiN
MFLHLVMLRLEAADERFQQDIRSYLDRVRAEVPGVLSYHFGPNAADRGKGYDWAVAGMFASAAAHDAYQTSPAHLALKDFITPHIADLVVCDLDTDSVGSYPA